MSKVMQVETRVKEVSEYFVTNKSTVRATATKFKISKSTVYKDLTERLINLDLNMYKQAIAVLSLNKEERSIRGGQATKRIFKKN